MCVIQLIIGDRSLHHTTTNAQCIVFRNLCLHGAGWDETVEQLRPLRDGEHKRTIKCSLVLTQQQSTDHTEDKLTTSTTAITTTNTTGTCTYNCPLLVVRRGETMLSSAPVLCSIQMPCSCELEAIATSTRHRVTAYSQNCMHKGQSACDNCLSVFLSCEWPT